MGILVSPESASHWYERDGSPKYTIIGANGKERAPTLREARKLGLLPSVTGIIGIISKPQLESWKIEQGILAALTLPRISGESDDEFAKRVVLDSREQVISAADTGTLLHDWVEKLAAGEALQAPEGFEAVCSSLRDWVYENLSGDFLSEIGVASRHGFGGRVDWYGELKDGTMAVIDWKSQGVKTGREANFYETWGLQLAAYALAIGEMGVVYGIPQRRISVVISTNPENPIVAIKEWEDFKSDMETFLHALSIWKWQKGYDPSFSLIEDTVPEYEKEE